MKKNETKENKLKDIDWKKKLRKWETKTKWQNNGNGN